MTNTPTTFSVQANAKLNLYLDIGPRREDGFHSLASIFQEISWSDTLEFKSSKRPEDSLIVEGPFAAEVPTDRDNIVLKAVELFRREVVQDLQTVEILLVKNIPTQAGLGGGSSDATGILLGLAERYSPSLSTERLCELAAILGSDCPFFVKGGIQSVSGRGEVLEPLESALDNSEYKVVVGVPNAMVNTKQAFADLSDADKNSVTVQRDFISNLKDDAVRMGLSHNSFLRSARQRHDNINELIVALTRSEAKLYGMTGSGSTCFGIFNASQDVEKFVEEIKPNCRALKVCAPVNCVG